MTLNFFKYLDEARTVLGGNVGWSDAVAKIQNFFFHVPQKKENHTTQG